MVDTWTKVPIFVCVDRIVDGSCSNNLIKIIMNVLLKVGGVEQRRFVQEIIVFCK
jgi:hypothetical protein